MPLGNKFISTYHRLFISGQEYLAENFSRNKNMDVKDVNLIQGTALTQILDIGGVTEDISATVPILVGPGSVYDGSSLLTAKINEVLNENYQIPILKGANVTIGRDGCKATINLLSDGIPNPNTFKIGGRQPADSILNPKTHTPTRVAKWYDFRVNVGKYQLYIENLTINMNVTADNLYFMGGTAAHANNNTDRPNDTGGTYNFGTQFPYIVVKSVGISGSGKAAVEMGSSAGADGYYDYEGSVDEALNVALGTNEKSELTLQRPGRVLWEADQFVIQKFVPTNQATADTPGGTNVDENTGAWTALFGNLDMSKSVIKKANFTMPANDKMTVEFEFHCWVGK